MSVNGNQSKEQRQWVFLVNNCVFDSDKNVENKPTLVRLRHPKTDVGSYFLFTREDKDIFEVTLFKEEFRSWIIESTVQQDGGLYITTPVDPVFMVIPYLVKAEKSGKYMTMDQIVVDEYYPECNRLTSTEGLSELYQVADTKGNDDLRAYRFNKDKTLSWLKLKTEKLADTLSEKKVQLSGAHCVTYVRSNKRSSIDETDYIRYAYGMVSEYISPDLSVCLRDYLGLPVVEEKKEEPPSKKSKNEVLAPSEDYSKNQKTDKSQKDAKLTQAQKKLNKVDKSGMKSMMSFFSPKAKT